MRYILFLSTLCAISLNAQNFKKVQCKTTPDTILIIKNDKFGFYDLKNKKVFVKPKFEEAALFQTEYTMIFSDNPLTKKYSDENYATVRYKGSRFRMDKSGKLVYKIPLTQEPPPPSSAESKYKITTDNYLYGLKFKDKQIVGNIYDDISELFYLDDNNSYFKVQKKNKYGVIDGRGVILVDISYDEIDNPKKWDLQKNGTILIVTKNNKKEIIDLCNNHY